MKINLAKSAGFCFGVKRAIEIALKTSRMQNNVLMLGDIVHNEDVVKQIKRAGIKKISKLTPDKNKALLIRAHGSSLNIFKEAQSLGYMVIDATCPMVKEIHKIARSMEKKGYKIIVIGDKRHDEVLGIIGQVKGKAMVIDKPENIPNASINKINKACVVVQSTQNIDNVLKIIGILKKHIAKLEFFNTICIPTSTKQEEIKRLPRETDVMIIIGSKKSANTKRLFEISKSINKRSYWVNSKNELKRKWFKYTKSVGITAGASTPDATTQEIVNYIKQIKL